ncbi:MAG: glycosyltransferase, partial [Candidatus Omnitrophota bacterium]
GKIDSSYQSLIGESETLGIRNRVIFTDYVGHDDLPCVYNGAEAFVLPTFNEWFGIPVLEAMACGVPVAVSKNTGALEVVGAAALQFDPADIRDIADCLKRVIEDRALRERMRDDGSRLVKQYTMEKMARETLNIYKGCVT